MNLIERIGKRRAGFEIDMTNGPLLGKIVRFAIPLALSGILQLLFNAADIVVVGHILLCQLWSLSHGKLEDNA